MHTELMQNRKGIHQQPTKTRCISCQYICFVLLLNIVFKQLTFLMYQSPLHYYIITSVFQYLLSFRMLWEGFLFRFLYRHMGFRPIFSSHFYRTGKWLPYSKYGWQYYLLFLSGLWKQKKIFVLYEHTWIKTEKYIVNILINHYSSSVTHDWSLFNTLHSSYVWKLTENSSEWWIIQIQSHYKVEFALITVLWNAVFHREFKRTIYHFPQAVLIFHIYIFYKLYFHLITFNFLLLNL